MLASALIGGVPAPAHAWPDPCFGITYGEIKASDPHTCISHDPDFFAPIQHGDDEWMKNVDRATMNDLEQNRRSVDAMQRMGGSANLRRALAILQLTMVPPGPSIAPAYMAAHAQVSPADRPRAKALYEELLAAYRTETRGTPASQQMGEAALVLLLVAYKAYNGQTLSRPGEAWRIGVKLDERLALDPTWLRTSHDGRRALFEIAAINAEFIPSIAELAPRLGSTPKEASTLTHDYSGQVLRQFFKIDPDHRSLDDVACTLLGSIMCWYYKSIPPGS